MTFSSSLAQRGWKECLFSEFVEIAPQVKLNNGSVYSFIEMADLSENSKYCVSKETRTFNGSGTRFEEKDTLFARITPCLENGKICQVRGLLNNKAFGSTEFHVFRGKTGISDTDFVFYLSRWNEVRDFAEANLHGTSGRQRVPKESFDNLLLNLPSLPEQRAIAGVLSSLDDKIDLLHRQNKTLEGIAESLWRKMFVEDADPNWKKGTLSEFGRIVCGKTPSKKNSEYFDGRVPFIKIPDMHGNVFIFDTEDLLTEEGRTSQDNKTIPARSVCVSCIATVGLVGMNAIDSQTNQQINTIIPNEEYQRYYLFLLMRSMTDDLYARASGGTATDNLNTGDFSRIEVSRAPESIIKNFDGIVKNYFEKIYANQLQIRTLSRLRDTLLPKLMSRELKVQA
ncbi:MAG: hypothetical protein A2471_04285 [Omnitrophica WOR_2 bacterium RIFOXYC2_FULL_45_15]|nr:MAG: hypothetical protein A2471_04285 [Omnitrophica WOR_2 bacterium RIFOXYC2_FULL_45_15]